MTKLKVPTTDQKRVIFDPDFGYTVELASARRDDATICGVCGLMNACRIPAKIERLEKQTHTRLGLRNCKLFEPVIGFAPAAQVFPKDQPFNTIRPGLGWLNRLNVGSTVSLVCTKELTVIMRCQVTELVKGPMATIIYEHASLNHMMKKDVPDPVRYMEDIIRQFYGPHIAAPEKKSVAIYLQPV